MKWSPYIWYPYVWYNTLALLFPWGEYVYCEVKKKGYELYLKKVTIPISQKA